MTDGPVRVMPREPLEANDYGVDGLAVRLPPDGARHFYTDAEFAAHFVPADAYERLIAAVERAAHDHAWSVIAATKDMSTAPPLASACRCELCAAYRAYVGGD